MQQFKILVLLTCTLVLSACGNGSSDIHAEQGKPSSPVVNAPLKQEFGDVVMRMVADKKDTHAPEAIYPETWSFNVNDNEAAFDRLF